MHRPRPALSALEAAAPVEEKERRVALAFIDAACLLGVDGRGEPAEVHFAEDMAVWLLAIDWANASTSSDRLQHLTTEEGAVRASIPTAFPRKRTRAADVGPRARSIARQHFAHRQARASRLARILQLDATG